MTIKSSNAYGDQLKQRLAQVFTKFANLRTGSAGAQEADATLVVFDLQICHIETGQCLSIQDMQPETLALAASNLVIGIEPAPKVVLLLPPNRFLVTQVQLPGIAKESLVSAIKLQSSVIVPSYAGQLSFKVNAASSSSDTHNVVWMDTAELDAYYAAFEAQGLFLVATLPRVLSAPLQDTDLTLRDEDASTMTEVRCIDGVISHWSQVSKSDLSEEHFAAQWRETSEALKGSNPACERSRAQDYLASSDDSLLLPYAFEPSGAIKAAKQTEKGKRVIVAIAAMFVVACMIASPFLYQSFVIKRLENRLTQTMVESSAARADQAIVRQFEERWGVLNEFPVQDISTMLLALQQELSPSVLSSLEVDEGLVEIEGESPDPQSLLERLEQNEAFAGVDFSRATNNNRYYIEMRLSTVDFDSYKQWYFPDVRR